MTYDEIVAQINDIMVTGFEISPDLLKPEAHLFKDLGLDSLDGVDLVVAIEKQVGCTIEEAAARSMQTLGDIYAYVETRLKAAGQSG